MNFCKVWLAGLLLVVFWGSPTWAERVGAARCGPASQGWLWQGGDILMIDQITVGPKRALLWDGRRVSIVWLRARLVQIGRSKLASAHRVEVVLAPGGRCDDLDMVRGMMDRTLDCKAGMCRDGDLGGPPPPR